RRVPVHVDRAGPPLAIEWVHFRQTARLRGSRVQHDAQADGPRDGAFHLAYPGPTVNLVGRTLEFAQGPDDGSPRVRTSSRVAARCGLDDGVWGGRPVAGRSAPRE